MRDRRDYLIAALAAAFLFCAGLLVGQQADLLPSAQAQDPTNDTGFDPESTQSPSGVRVPAINIPQSPAQPSIRPPGLGRTYSPTSSDSDSNNRFIAVTCPVGSGESVLFLIDSKTEQLTCYRFVRRKGLEFLAGRKIKYDLKISGYKDISEFSHDKMKRLWDKQRARSVAEAAKKKKK